MCSQLPNDLPSHSSNISVREIFARFLRLRFKSSSHSLRKIDDWKASHTRPRTSIIECADRCIALSKSDYGHQCNVRVSLVRANRESSEEGSRKGESSRSHDKADRANYRRDPDGHGDLRVYRVTTTEKVWQRSMDEYMRRHLGPRRVRITIRSYKIRLHRRQVRMRYLERNIVYSSDCSLII